MELVIKGDDNYIKKLAKELKPRAKRNNLELSLIIKKQEDSTPPVKKQVVKSNKKK